jgi:RNA recognition motif-containing protein
MNIFVAKLNSSTTSEDLRELFEKYGSVTSANVIIDKMTGYSRLFGFVEMEDEAKANNAIKELNECTFDNSRIVVKQARPKVETSRSENNGYRSRY